MTFSRCTRLMSACAEWKVLLAASISLRTCCSLPLAWPAAPALTVAARVAAAARIESTLLRDIVVSTPCVAGSRVSSLDLSDDPGVVGDDLLAGRVVDGF